MEWDSIIPILFLFAGATSGIRLLSTGTHHDDYFYSPRQIYLNTEMNWFGCILVYLLFWIITPLYQFIALIYIFGKFIYWLCHVGRKGY